MVTRDATLPSEEALTHRGLLSSAWAYRWLVAIIVLSFSVGALLYSVSRPPKFVAVSTVVLDDQAAAASVGLVPEGNSARIVRTQIQIFRSTSVAAAAVELAEEQGVAVGIRDVVANSSFTNLNDTSVITVTFTHEDQLTAEVVVGALVDGYRQVRLEQHQAETEAVLLQFESAELLLKDELVALEREISGLRAVRGLPTEIALLLDRIARDGVSTLRRERRSGRFARIVEFMSIRLGALRLARRSRV